MSAGFVANRVREVARALRRPRMIRTRDTQVAFSLLEEAEKRGELSVYRVGIAAFVDEDEFFAWVRKTGCKPAVRQ